MQAITSFYQACFLNTSLRPTTTYINIRKRVYIYMWNISAFLMWYMTFPLFPSTLLRLLHANNWWWTNKMASFGFGPGNPARRYPRVCRLFGNAIPFRHARQPIYPIHTHTHHTLAHTPSRTFISMQEMKAASVSWPRQQTRVISFYHYVG